MRNLESNLKNKEIKELKEEYNQSYCSTCPFSPGIKYLKNNGLNCPGFFATKKDLTENQNRIYPFPKDFGECPYL